MKKWTQEELERQVRDKRPLKVLGRRKSDKGLSFAELTRKIAEKTGYTYNATAEVMKAMTEIMNETFEKKQYVKISGICTFYPTVKRARQGTCLKGGFSKEQMIVEPRWELRCQIGATVARKLKEIEVTEEDIEKLFK